MRYFVRSQKKGNEKENVRRNEQKKLWQLKVICM